MTTRKQQGTQLSVVGSPPPPAKPPPRSYADFDKWVALGRSLGNYDDRLNDMMHVPDNVEDKLESGRISEADAAKSSPPGR